MIVLSLVEPGLRFPLHYNYFFRTRFVVPLVSGLFRMHAAVDEMLLEGTQFAFVFETLDLGLIHTDHWLASERKIMYHKMTTIEVHIVNKKRIDEVITILLQRSSIFPDNA